MKKSSTVLGNDQGISGDGGGAARGWSGEDDKSLVEAGASKVVLGNSQPFPATIAGFAPSADRSFLVQAWPISVRSQERWV